MPEDIAQAQATSSQKIHWRRVSIITIAAIIILAILIALWWWFFLRPPNESLEPSTKPSPTKTSTPSAKKDETANCKVYSNKKLGFSIKHPCNWFAHDELSDPEQFNRVILSNEKLSSQTQVNMSIFSCTKSY